VISNRISTALSIGYQKEVYRMTEAQAARHVVVAVGNDLIAVIDSVFEFLVAVVIPVVFVFGLPAGAAIPAVFEVPVVSVSELPVDAVILAVFVLLVGVVIPVVSGLLAVVEKVEREAEFVTVVGLRSLYKGQIIPQLPPFWLCCLSFLPNNMT
jgi:hypothetical protein